MSFFSTGDSSPLWPLHQSGCSALFPTYHTFLSNIVPTRVLHTGPHYESICFCFLVGFPSGFSCVLASPSSSYWIKVFISGRSPFALGWVSRVGWQSWRVPWRSSMGHGPSVHTSAQQLPKDPKGGLDLEALGIREWGPYAILHIWPWGSRMGQEIRALCAQGLG